MIDWKSPPILVLSVFLVAFMLGTTFGVFLGMEITEDQVKELKAENEYLKNKINIRDDQLSEYVEETLILRSLLNNSTQVLAYIKGVQAENDRLWDLNYHLIEALEHYIGKNETWKLVYELSEEVYGFGNKT